MHLKTHVSQFLLHSSDEQISEFLKFRKCIAEMPAEMPWGAIEDKDRDGVIRILSEIAKTKPMYQPQVQSVLDTLTTNGVWQESYLRSGLAFGTSDMPARAPETNSRGIECALPELVSNDLRARLEEELQQIQRCNASFEALEPRIKSLEQRCF
jgi:hypothetical protein